MTVGKRYMGYRIRRVDSNQNRIVSVLRGLGAKVLILSEMGRGVPDILIAIRRPGRGRFMQLIEIKDGSKPKSAQKLTSDEHKFHEDWRDFVTIVSTEQEAVDLVERVLRGEI